MGQPVRQVQQPMYGQPPLGYGQPLPSQPMNVSWNMPPNGAPLMGGHPAVLQARPQGAHGPTRPPLTRLTRARINTQLYINTADAKQPQSPLTVAGIAPSPLMHLPEIISVSPASSSRGNSRTRTILTRCIPRCPTTLRYRHVSRSLQHRRLNRQK